MTKLHPTEPIATFDLGIPATQAARFFEAVNWQLPAKPATPPTLATIFRDGEFAALTKLGISLKSVLHGEQKYRFHKDLEAGVTYRGETFVSSQYEKGTMRFFVFQTNLKDSSGTSCVECLTTIIVRGQS